MQQQTERKPVQTRAETFNPKNRRIGDVFDVSDVKPRFRSNKYDFSTSDRLTAESVNYMMQTIIELKMAVNEACQDVAMMRDEVRSLADKLDDITKETDFEGYDVREMPVDEIKKLLLDKMGGGEPFYPSDIATDYNLDYDAVMEAVGVLRKEGRIKE